MADTINRSDLIGHLSASIAPLLWMLDGVKTVSLKEAVAGSGGLAGCDPAIFGPLISPDKMRIICDNCLDTARASPLMKHLPKTIEGLPAEDFVAAFALYTMETPFPFYKLLTKALNVSGIRSKEKLLFQLPYLKILSVGLENIPRKSLYWCLRVLYRGLDVTKSPMLQEKYDNYQTAFAPGTKITFAAPTSTTTNSSVAGQFTRGIQFVFQGATPDRGPGGIVLNVSVPRSAYLIT
jgi:hypothetical protein